MEQFENVKERSEPESKQKAGITPATIFLTIWVLVLTGIMAWMANGQSQLRQELALQREDVQQQVAAVDTRLEARAGELERNVTDVRDDLGTTAQKVGVTQKQLATARAQAQKAREGPRKASPAAGCAAGGIRGARRQAHPEVGLVGGVAAEGAPG